MFFIAVAFLVLCQVVGASPMDSTTNAADSTVQDTIWRELPVAKVKAIDVPDPQIMLDSFPEAQHFADSLTKYGFNFVHAEKIGILGMWLNGEGAIGAIRYDHSDPKKPGLWLIMGRGFGGTRYVSVLMPKDTIESEYYVYVCNDLHHRKFHMLPFVIRSQKYPGYKEYIKSIPKDGKVGGYLEFFGSNLGEMKVADELFQKSAIEQAIYNWFHRHWKFITILVIVILALIISLPLVL